MDTISMYDEFSAMTALSNRQSVYSDLSQVHWLKSDSGSTREAPYHP